MVGVAAVIALPVVLSSLHLSRLGEELIRWLGWPALCILVLIGLSVAYRFGPAQPPPRRGWVSPGSLMATALWLAGSVIFSWVAGATAKIGRIDASLGVGAAKHG